MFLLKITREAGKVEGCPGRRQAVIDGRTVQLLETHSFPRPPNADIHGCYDSAKSLDGHNPQSNACDPARRSDSHLAGSDDCRASEARRTSQSSARRLPRVLSSIKKDQLGEV